MILERDKRHYALACGALDPFVTGPYRTERLFSPGELLDAAAPRTARVETAPARGLFLHKVFYGKIPA